MAAGLILTGCGSDTRPTPLGPASVGPGAAPPSIPRSTGPIAFTSNRDGSDFVYLANEDGSAITRLTPGRSPSWSRDGRSLVFENRGEIYTIGVSGAPLRQVATGRAPAWSPDGRTIAFESCCGSLGDRPTIELVDADGSNRRRIYQEPGSGGFNVAWSPNSRQIVFCVGPYTDLVMGLWTSDADGAHMRHLGPMIATAPAWSPDGDSIAFVNSTGLFVVNANGSGERMQLAGNTVDVDWAPDGRLVFSRWLALDGSGASRIFVAVGGLERQLIPDAQNPARRTYGDYDVAWLR